MIKKKLQNISTQPKTYLKKKQRIDALFPSFRADSQLSLCLFFLTPCPFLWHGYPYISINTPKAWKTVRHGQSKFVKGQFCRFLGNCFRLTNLQQIIYSVFCLLETRMLFSAFNFLVSFHFPQLLKMYQQQTCGHLLPKFPWNREYNLSEWFEASVSLYKLSHLPHRSIST